MILIMTQPQYITYSSTVSNTYSFHCIHVLTTCCTVYKYLCCVMKSPQSCILYLWHMIFPHTEWILHTWSFNCKPVTIGYSMQLVSLKQHDCMVFSKIMTKSNIFLNPTTYTDLNTCTAQLSYWTIQQEHGVGRGRITLFLKTVNCKTFCNISRFWLVTSQLGRPLAKWYQITKSVLPSTVASFCQE